MEVECAEWRHVPNYFWKHAKSDHDLEISLESFEFLMEFWAFQIGWLEDVQAEFLGGFFDRRTDEFLTSALRLVRCGDDSDHVPAAFHELFQGRHCKLWCAHVDDAEVFSFYFCIRHSVFSVNIDIRKSATPNLEYQFSNHL